MAKKSEWDLLKRAVEESSSALDPIVRAGPVAERRAVGLQHDQVLCSACGEVVRIANFVCPKCGGSVRKKAPAKRWRQLGDCWECHQPIGTTAKICPHCGADQRKKPPPAWAVTVASVIGLAVLFYLVFRSLVK